MADEIVQSAAPSPSPAVTQGPVEGAASPAPATPAPVAPVEASPGPAPVVEAAKPAEQAPIELSTDKPTLLETFDAGKAEADKAAAPASDAAKPDVAAEPPPQAQEPTAWKFDLPATLKDSPKEMGEFTGILNDVAKLPPQEVGQKLINLHATAMQTYADHVLREQHRVFNETRQGWIKQVMSDPEMGGSGHQTAMGAIARMRDLLVSQADRPAFDEFLRVTGAGDHPQFLKILHNAARYFDEPAMPPANIRPPPSNGARPGGRLRDLYTHPRSNMTGRQ